MTTAALASRRDPALLRRLAATITSELGIKMPEDKLTMLRNRLQRRLNELGLRSLDAYAARLRDPAHAEAERIHLFDLATTNKTDFFREPAHFANLTKHALPALSERGDRWHCRVWCAGCSTGQEVYTLAMVLHDYARGHAGFDFEILGTDVSVRVLRPGGYLFSGHTESVSRLGLPLTAESSSILRRNP